MPVSERLDPLLRLELRVGSHHPSPADTTRPERPERPPDPRRTMRIHGMRQKDGWCFVTAVFAWGLGLGTVSVIGAEDAAAARPAESFSPEALDFFETRVRPILAESCLRCHGEKKQSSELRLDSR